MLYPHSTLRDLIKAADPFGPLHIAIDDGNVDDTSLAFCERQGLDTLETEIVRRLKLLSFEDREAAVR